MVFVQSRNVYPQLLLGRLFFSLGGAAASTMVTAVLPAVCYRPYSLLDTPPRGATESDSLPASQQSRRGHSASIASELTITPARYRLSHGPALRTQRSDADDVEMSTSRTAGFVGMLTGCGALIALVIFLPLPARFQNRGFSPGSALQISYYIVAAISFVLAVVCLVGLRRLHSDEEKGLSKLRFWRNTKTGAERPSESQPQASWRLLDAAFRAGFQRSDIGLGYLGGFVARASSVGISLFIPLLVNAMFLSSGLCAVQSAADTPAGLPDIKRKCPRAYIVAAQLTGTSQLVALVSAPVFGYLSSKSRIKNLPLMVATTAGTIGYPLFATQFSPRNEERQRRVVAFLAVSLIGISQIGAIVCSLGLLSGGILQRSPDTVVTGPTHNAPSSEANGGEGEDEHSPLLESGALQPTMQPLSAMKGSIAGVYSFYGGGAILILTKLGGSLFDRLSTGAPFYIMAIFNSCLLIACLVVNAKRYVESRSKGPS